MRIKFETIFFMMKVGNLKARDPTSRHNGTTVPDWMPISVSASCINDCRQSRPSRFPFRHYVTNRRSSFANTATPGCYRLHQNHMWPLGTVNFDTVGPWEIIEIIS